MEILKKIADCCIKEAQSWVSNIQAMAKAKADEDKAKRREETKEAKRVEQAEKKKRDKIIKEAKAKGEKEKKALEKKAQDAANGQNAEGAEEDGGKSKKRNRTRTGHQELTSEDPDLFHNMFKLPMGAMAETSEIADFLQQIAEVPGAACVARLRRGAFKKALTDLWPELKHVFF